MFYAESESDYCPSWIQAFNKEVIQTLSFSEHEAFDHPVACKIRPLLEGCPMDGEHFLVEKNASILKV